MLRQLRVLKVSNLQVGLRNAAQLPADRAGLAQKLVRVFRDRSPCSKAFSDVHKSELGTGIGKWIRRRRITPYER